MRPEIFPTAMIASMAMLFSLAHAQAETIQDQLDDSPRHLEFIDVPVEGSESIAALIGTLRRRAEQEFSWPHLTERLLRVYKRLLTESTAAVA